MNTIENTVIFLPALWVAALFGATTIVAAVGPVRTRARILYSNAYRKDPTKRGSGYGISLTAFAVIFVDAATGVARSLLTS